MRQLLNHAEDFYLTWFSFKRAFNIPTTPQIRIKDPAESVYRLMLKASAAAGKIPSSTEMRAISERNTISHVLSSGALRIAVRIS